MCRVVSGRGGRGWHVRLDRGGHGGHAPLVHDSAGAKDGGMRKQGVDKRDASFMHIVWDPPTKQWFDEKQFSCALLIVLGGVTRGYLDTYKYIYTMNGLF